MTAKDLNQIAKFFKVDTNEISDGYHTFGELYEHRIVLWIMLCRAQSYSGEFFEPCRSQHHSDGELAFGGGWFVLGIGREAGEQMTYHLPMSYWHLCSFAETLNRAPEFDGHTSADVLVRLFKNL